MKLAIFCLAVGMAAIVYNLSLAYDRIQQLEATSYLNECEHIFTGP